MRELRQDWRDIFGSFRVAFDVWKLLLGFLGVVVTYLVLWGLSCLPAVIIAAIVGLVLVIGLVIKFALSDTGFTLSKVVMIGGVVVALTGAVLLCGLTETGQYWGRTGGLALAVLVIWAFFGGGIARIAAVEVAADDRIGLGEAASFACKKYGAYLGATVLPALAVLFLALCCTLFGLVFRIPGISFLVAVLFFLVPLAGFLMFLIALGGVAGAPLMYPAVAAEGNDSFDAISRAYSYVFGRPWRYIFYNLAALVYGLACTFFVGFFVKQMLDWSLAAVSYGTGGGFEENIIPRLKTLLSPLNNLVLRAVEGLGSWIADWDVTGYLASAFDAASKHLGLQPFAADNLELGWNAATASVLIAIVVYIIIGLVVAYVISLFFSMQTTIYLLLRKRVDGAEMTEVYREEEEEDYLSVTPAAEPEAEADEKAEAEEEPKKKAPAKKKGTTKKKAPRQKKKED